MTCINYEKNDDKKMKTNHGWGVLVIAVVFSMFLVTSHINANPSSKECVIVLHGLGRTARSMSAIESALKTTGYVVMNVGYPSRKHPIETLVDQYVRPVVARCKGASTIHFVTHSMGGILKAFPIHCHRLILDWGLLQEQNQSIHFFRI